MKRRVKCKVGLYSKKGNPTLHFLGSFWLDIVLSSVAVPSYLVSVCMQFISDKIPRRCSTSCYSI